MTKKQLNDYTLWTEKRMAPLALSDEEQSQLICKYQSNRTQELEDLLVLYNIRLVKSLISRKVYFQYIKSMDFDDVLSVGMRELLKAVRAYNPEKGKFSTFASTVVLNGVNKMLTDLNTDSRGGKIQDLSLDEALFENDDGAEFTRYDQIAAPNSNTENIAIEKDEIRNIFQAVENSGTKPMKKRNIEMFYAHYIDGIKTSQLAAKNGINRVTVNRTFAKIRGRIKDYYQVDSSDGDKETFFFDSQTPELQALKRKSLSVGSADKITENKLAL